MADTTPRLNTAPADPQLNYAPLSWIAVLAFAIAALFAMILISLAYFAYRNNKPLIETWLYIPPVLGIVAAFAARRHIRNSEGTRTGLEWSTRGWWISVVGGLGYFTYVNATEYTVNYETKKQLATWAENCKKADLVTPNDPALGEAFYQTLPPSQRVAFSASNTTEMQNRFAQEMVTFRQNKLLMILQRNRDRAEIVPGTLMTWQVMPEKIECTVAATLKTPEGEFPLVIPMVALLTKGKREWQIGAFDNYVQIASDTQRTQYGWLVEWLDGTARITAEQFLSSAAAKTNQDGFPVFVPDGILAQPVAHDVFASRKFAKPVGDRIVFGAVDRMALTGPLGLFWPTSPAYAKGIRGDFFVQTPLADGKMVPDASREDFLACWNNTGFDTLIPSGKTLSGSTDKNNLMRFFDDRVEVSVPIELKVPKADAKGSAALGRLILTLDDPELLGELDRARELGLKGEKSNAFPEDLKQRMPAWKVTRIESNLKVIRAALGPGGPPGGPGGGG